MDYKLIKLNVYRLSDAIKQIFIIVLLYLSTVLFSISHASHHEMCTTKIHSIKVAKGSGTVGEQKTINTWLPIAQLPDKWTKRWPDYSGTVWYKIDWISDCKSKHQPILLVVSSISMAGQIYINDDLLWQDQALVEPLSRSWYTPRKWRIPPYSMQEGLNTTWIRVVGVSSHLPGLGKVYLGEVEKNNSIFEKLYFESKVLNIAHFTMNLTLIILALFAWAIARKESAFGWYALNASLWAVYLFNAMHTEPLFGLNTIDYERWLNCVFAGYVAAKCLFGWRFIGLNFPKIEKVLTFFVLITVIGNVLLPMQYVMPWFQFTFAIAMLIFLVNCFSYIFLAYRQKRVEGYLLAVNYLIYIPLSIHDALWVAGIVGGNPASIYASPIATLFVATLLAWKLAQNFKRIEKFNETLESTVIQVKEELSNSLNNAHQLEIENTKLQERMNLAHDLHDGLGGSMVRSMAMLEQSKNNLTNRQFLSMMKLLRDDLRQIIDYGSGLSAKPPENPLIWIAPLRHRFNQIFDELDIQTDWHIPTEWHIEISAIDCLTYQRVIEEALTNMLKHSHATQVEVRLDIETQSGLLTLNIQDNGFGFDVALVNDAGISVGLRSMQLRLEKIKADMQIVSHTGMTHIQVTKPYVIVSKVLID